MLCLAWCDLQVCNHYAWHNLSTLAKELSRSFFEQMMVIMENLVCVWVGVIFIFTLEEGCVPSVKSLCRRKATLESPQRRLRLLLWVLLLWVAGTNCKPTCLAFVFRWQPGRAVG